MLKKQIAEVELFILSGKSLDDDIKKGWNDEMIKFYKTKVMENVNGRNQGDVASSSACAMEEDVSKDTSAHAEFMTQNDVSTVVDGSMASMMNYSVVVSTSFIS